jgi:hypothetical protein
LQETDGGFKEKRFAAGTFIGPAFDNILP